jgi:hypothetical protein
LRGRQLADRGARVIGKSNDADVFGMVGDAGEIERRVDLDVVAARRLDRLALEILVGVARTGESGAGDPGVERVAGVNVCLAEIRVAKGVALSERGLKNEADKSGSQYGRCGITLLRRLFHRRLPILICFSLGQHLDLFFARSAPQFQFYRLRLAWHWLPAHNNQYNANFCAGA